MGEERLVHEWRDRPYTSYQKRSWTVRHRWMLRVHGAGTDLEHEVRSHDDPSIPESWTTVEAFEIRRGSVEKVSLTDRPEVLR